MDTTGEEGLGRYTDTDLSTVHDSAIGGLGSYMSSTYTAAGSRMEENGRTYHIYKDGKYLLPNDEIELNRLNIQHKMWLITLDDKLHLAPIGPTPQNCLDIATGTGIWATEFADTYPSANTIGSDLTLIQPSYIPPNCRFEIGDIEDEWLYGTKFDYIHGRALMTFFNDGKSVVDKAYDALAPGGYFELQDIELQKSDDGSTKGTFIEAIHNHIAEGMKKDGRSSWGANVSKYKDFMVEKGFEDVTERTFKWPCNQGWPEGRKEKLLGAWWQAQIKAGLLESVSTRLFMEKLGWSKEELTDFLTLVKRDMGDPKIKAFTPITVVWGRKPLNA